MECISCGRQFHCPPENIVPICGKCVLGGADRYSDDSHEESVYESREDVSQNLAWIQKLFPDFEILERVGAGGMGTVYKARQLSLDRLVAIKILHPHREGDAEFEARFKREAKAMAMLSHPNIVAVHDFGRRERVHFLVMEYVPGQDLQKMINSGLVYRETAFSVVEQICAALHFAHGKGVVHRDIKPGNILVGEDGTVKVGDFGIARAFGLENEVTLTQSDVGMGTPAYVAPEQIADASDIDARADIYALGVVIYVMFTGQLPSGRFPPPTSRFPRRNKRLDEAVLKAMATNPDERFSDAEEVMRAMEAAAKRGDTDSSSKESRIIAVALVLLVTGVVVVGWLFASSRPGLRSKFLKQKKYPPVSVENLIPKAGLTGTPEFEKVRRQGGTLRNWSEIPEGLVDLSAAEGIGDLVFVEEGVNVAMSWYGGRADGEMVSSIPSWNLRNDYRWIKHSFWVERPDLLRPVEESNSSFLPLLTPVSRVVDLTQSYDTALLLKPDHRVAFAARMPWIRSHQYVIQRVEAMDDVAAVDSWGNLFSILRENGDVVSWIEPHGFFDPPLDSRRFVQVAASGQFVVGLYEDGTVTTWCHPRSRRHPRIDAVLQVPKNLGPAIRVKAFDFTCAMQRPDGSWFAWGDDQDRGLIERINSMGVALDLALFHVNVSTGAKMVWIAPADESSDPEYAKATNR